MSTCSISTIWRRAKACERLVVVGLLLTALPLSAQDWWWGPTLRGHLLSQAEAGLSLAVALPADFDGLAAFASGAWGLQAYRGYLGLGRIEPTGRQRFQWAASSASIGAAVLRTRHHPWFGNAESLYWGIEARWAPALDQSNTAAWLRGLHCDGSVLHDPDQNDTLAAFGLGWGF